LKLFSFFFQKGGKAKGGKAKKEGDEGVELTIEEREAKAKLRIEALERELGKLMNFSQSDFPKIEISSSTACAGRNPRESLRVA
jgi:hypothetical protein